LGSILACLSGMVLPAPVIGLVGPAREAPEFAPYVVAVLDKRGGGSFCTASVIAPNVVLTAAHCVSNLSDARVFYRGGQGRQVFFDVALIITWTLAVAALFVLLALCFGRVRERAGVKMGLAGVILFGGLFGGAIASYFWTDIAARLVFFDIAAIAVHPEFRPKIGRKRLISIDLALLRLASPLPPAFKPIELADSGPVATGQPFRIAGFGRADESVRGT
jgi:hypothetical protein